MLVSIQKPKFIKVGLYEPRMIDAFFFEVVECLLAALVHALLRHGRLAGMR